MSLFKTYILLSALAVFVLLTSCGDDPEPDPCAEENPVSAAFRIEETFQLAHLLPESWEFYDTDTVNTNYVMFTALEDSAEYEWKLGSETITTRSFTRYGFPRGENIQVSLKVTKSPNLGCFPDDDGEDEVSRSFYVTEQFICGSLVTGTYIGFNTDDESNERTIIIDVCYVRPNDNPLNETKVRLINLVPDCDLFSFGTRFSAYKQLAFGADPTQVCLNPTGIATVFGVKNDSIKINYTIRQAPGVFDDLINKTFVGTRKN